MTATATKPQTASAHSKPAARKAAGANTKKGKRASTATAKKRRSSDASTKRWSQRAGAKHDAAFLDEGVVDGRDATGIAPSLRRPADARPRGETGPYRAAVSRLTFYVSRAGKSLPASIQRVLSRAKEELRALLRHA